MAKRCVQRSVLCVAVLAAACGTTRDDSTVQVTIDRRCSANTDCPTDFVCAADTEHGPPTTMCESYDPDATCPREYDTHVGYGQVFCVARAGVRAHSGAPIVRTARSPHDTTSQADAPGARREERDQHLGRAAAVAVGVMSDR